jgi:hypothetical protein
MAETKTKAKTKKKTKSAADPNKKLGPSDEIAPKRRLKLEEGVERVFDMPKEMAGAVSGSFSFAELAKKISETPEEEVRKEYGAFGQAVMEKVVELATGEYLDRTGEMVELVAKQTGVRFPHCVQRFVELSILSLRPDDKWNVTVATTSEMRVREYSCSMNKALTEAGVNLEGLPCASSCFGGFIEAARASGTRLRIRHTAKLPDDGYCEFTFLPI